MNCDFPVNAAVKEYHAFIAVGTRCGRNKCSPEYILPVFADIQIHAMRTGNGHMGHDLPACQFRLHRHIRGISAETHAGSRRTQVQFPDARAHLLCLLFRKTHIPARYIVLIQAIYGKWFLLQIIIFQAFYIQAGWYIQIRVRFSYFHLCLRSGFPSCPCPALSAVSWP